MAWSAISSGETDSNSPINQITMDKVRGNLDYLKDQDDANAITSKILNSSDIANTSDPADFIIDATIDWRDRFIRITGQTAYGDATNVVKFLPGGSSDGAINSWSGAAAVSGPGLTVTVDMWMYTEEGAAGRATGTPIWAYTDSRTSNHSIWVDEANGKLMYSINFDAAAAKKAAWYLLVEYSADQGGV